MSEGPPASVRTARAAVTTGAMQSMVMLLMLARSKLFALLLGPVGVGIVSTLDQLVQFVVQAASFGLTVAPTRVVPRLAARDDAAVGRVYRGLLIALLLCVGGVTAVLIVLAALELGPLADITDLPRETTAIALAGAPLSALVLFFTSMFSVTLGYRASMRFVIAAAAVSLVFSYSGACAAGVTGLYIGALLGGILVCAGAVWRLSGYWHAAASSTGTSLRAGFSGHDRLGAFLGTVYVLSFAQPLAYLLVRAVVVESRGTVEAGHFQAVFAISGVLTMLLTQTGRLYFEPRLNRETMPRARALMTHDFMRVMSGLMVVGALPLALFPDVAIRMLFTSEFLPAAGGLYLFLLADCLFLGSWIYLAALRAQDDIAWSFWITLLGNLALAGLAWLLIPRWGVPGAGVAFLASRAGMLVASAARMNSRAGVTLDSGTGLALTYLVVSVAAAGLVANSWLEAAPAWGMRLAGLFMLVVGAMLLLRGEERRWLRQAAGRVLSRVRAA